MRSVFEPIRFLLLVCRFCWFLYTFNIHLYMHIFRRIILSNYWWQESDIWSQASYRHAILWKAFLDPSDSYFLFADLVGFYTHWTYMHHFRHIFLSNYWWQNYTPTSRRGRGVYCFTSVRLSFRPSKIFSVTVDGRNLIFGHKRHIDIPYCG